MKILITGANSFIGKHYIQHSRFKEIKAISLRHKKPEDINFDNIEIVLHLSALVHQRKRRTDKEYFYINKDLTIATAIAAKKAGVKQFIFMSTLSVYGNFPKNAEFLDEFSACRPVNAYGKSKLQAENELKKLNDSNFCVSIIRPPLVYGEDVIANMHSLINLVDKIPILPFANITNKRSFCALENLTEFIDKIIEYKVSGVFIAADLIPLSTTELVKEIAKNLDKKVLLFKVPKFILKIIAKIKPNIIDRLYGSFIAENSLTIERLNYKQKISTEQAIAKMIKPYLLKKKST